MTEGLINIPTFCRCFTFKIRACYPKRDALINLQWCIHIARRKASNRFVQMYLVLSSINEQ